MVLPVRTNSELDFRGITVTGAGDLSEQRSTRRLDV